MLSYRPPVVSYLLAPIVRVLDIVTLHPAAIFAAVARAPVALAGARLRRLAALIAAGVLLAFGSFATPGFLSSFFLSHLSLLH